MAEDEVLISKHQNKSYNRSLSHANDELCTVRSYLRYMCVDQSTIFNIILSWTVFIIFTIIVPAFSHFYLGCQACDAKHHRPYDGIVQLSLSSIATLSFLCLSKFVRKFGVRRFLFFDKLVHESNSVRSHYTSQLDLCSVTLLAGLMIILRSATKITHKAQAITALSAKWHVCATIDSFVTSETELPGANHTNAGLFDPRSLDSDDDDAGSEEDDVDTTKLLPAYAYSTISFQKRHALVTYFEKNRAGITLYGFMLDRTWLQLIFGVELSLVLFLLKKTINF